MNYLGIDPGHTGALALVSAETLQLLNLWDMPTLDGATDPFGLLDLQLATRQIGLAVIEWPGIMPKNGAFSARSMGYSLGVLAAITAALKIPTIRVTPSHWKREMGLTKDKGASRALASRRFPAEASYFSRVKDDGRAEAALLGLWLHGEQAGWWQHRSTKATKAKAAAMFETTPSGASPGADECR